LSQQPCLDEAVDCVTDGCQGRVLDCRVAGVRANTGTDTDIYFDDWFFIVVKNGVADVLRGQRRWLRSSQDRCA